MYYKDPNGYIWKYTWAWYLYDNDYDNKWVLMDYGQYILSDPYKYGMKINKLKEIPEEEVFLEFL